MPEPILLALAVATVLALAALIRNERRQRIARGEAFEDVFGRGKERERL